ncbi:MAG: phosphate transporter permease, partial [Sphingomonas bacterium]|nr:phosphate transporter permease [Sphingomonas bacterium]
MSGAALLFLILGLGGVAWATARAKASSFAVAGGGRPHSRPNYHGWYVALWAIVPALIFLAVWSSLAPGLVMGAALESPAASALPAFGMERSAILAEVRGLAEGSVTTPFNPLS